MTLCNGGHCGGRGGVGHRHLGGRVALGGAGLAATHAKQANFVGGGGGKMVIGWRLGWLCATLRGASASAGLAWWVAAGGGVLLIVNVILICILQPIGGQNSATYVPPATAPRFASVDAPAGRQCFVLEMGLAGSDARRLPDGFRVGYHFGITRRTAVGLSTGIEPVQHQRFLRRDWCAVEQSAIHYATSLMIAPGRVAAASTLASMNRRRGHSEIASARVITSGGAPRRRWDSQMASIACGCDGKKVCMVWLLRCKQCEDDTNAENPQQAYRPIDYQQCNDDKFK